MSSPKFVEILVFSEFVSHALNQGYSRLFTGIQRYLRVLISIHLYSRMPTGIHEYSRVLILRVLTSFQGSRQSSGPDCSRVRMSKHSCEMLKCIYNWYSPELTSRYGIYKYSWVIHGTQGYSWSLTAIHEYSYV